jgi:hypothetical protein
MNNNNNNNKDLYLIKGEYMVGNKKKLAFKYLIDLIPKKMDKELKKANLKKISKEKFESIKLFARKIKKIPFRPLKNLQGYTGNTRHVPTTLQEWNNSVYSYNKAYLKTLTVANKNLLNLLKNYFNFEVKDNVYKHKSLKTRFKKIRTKKIFLDKGKIKHTSTNVICTFFIYNTEKMFLNYKINKISDILFNSNKNLINEYNRPLTLYEYLSKTKNIWYYNYSIYHLNKTNIYLKKKIELIKLLKDLFKKDKSFNILMLDKLINMNIKLFVPTLGFFMEKRYWRYTMNWYKYLYQYRMNKIKFSKELISKLNRLAKNIYHKNIIFNFINLKSIYSNSDIFAQAIALKLKNKKNKYNKILRKSLLKAKIFSNNKLLESKINKNISLINSIRNNSVGSMSTNYKNSEDSLNKILSNLFPVKMKNKSVLISKRKKLSTENYLLHRLKYNKLSGIRLEIKGRLLNKLSAYRSMYKMVSAGSLKNIDSSYKGLSTTMLRGYAKPNVQHTFLSSTTKSGAFGVKGWISAK